MPSDSLLRFALFSGLVVFLLTVVLLVVIAVLRYVIDRYQRRERALAERWQPVFFHAIEGLPLVSPRIYGRDREVILLVWIHFTESIRGDARLRLSQLALELKLDSTAQKLLVRRDVRSQLMAVVALGRMEYAAAWDPLANLVADPNPILSLLAVRSLLQIDAGRAVPIMLGQLIARDDWPLAKVAAMLGDVPTAVLAPPLLHALDVMTEQSAPRLLSLLDTAHLGDTWPILAPLLQPVRSAETITAALKACNDPRALDAVRALATHAQWIVRAQAAAALGRLGVDEDRLRLQAMLGDPEWWVRYRAATALARLPFMSRQKLADLCARLDDRFAADILTQVLAETEAGAAA